MSRFVNNTKSFNMQLQGILITHSEKLSIYATTKLKSVSLAELSYTGTLFIEYDSKLTKKTDL